MKLFSVFQNLSLFTKSFLVLIFLFFLYGLGIHFFDGVMPIHEWRKTDSFSITWNYANGASFLSPETNFISNAGNRNAAAEFPIVYYIVGKIWSVFGQHEWIAKLISFSTLFLAISLFSKVVEYFYQNQLKTLLFVGIIFSSPVLIYYSDTLLPNVFSFAFLLYAGFFLFRYLIENRNSALLFFTIFLSLAVLIKVTVIIAVFTFCGAAFCYYFFHEKNLFSKHLKTFLIFLGVITLTLVFTYLWYSYAICYNKLYDSTLFSTTIRPIWEVDAQRRKEIWDIIWKYQFDMLFHHLILVPSILFVLYLAIRRKISAFFVWAIIIGFIGLFAYFILWFWVFDVHDYYLIEALFFPLIFLFNTVKYSDEILSRFTKTRRVVSILFILTLVLQAVSYTQIAFGKDNIITKNTFFVSPFVKGNWGYFHWYHKDHLKKLQEQAGEIQKIIKAEDTVLCITDPSPNIQLYTIKRFGFTTQNFFEGGDVKSRISEFVVDKGADYMLVIGPEVQDSAVLFFSQFKLYSKNNIKVYDLKPYKTKFSYK
jgi:hypothetical protein